MAKVTKKRTFIVDCPRCKAKVAADETGRVERTWYDSDAGEPFGEAISVGKCPRCTALVAGASYQTSFEGFEGDESNEWSDPVRVYPEPPKVFSSDRIPRSVTSSLVEGSNVLQANAPMAACMSFGRALEAVCRDLLFTAAEKQAIKDGTSRKRLMLAEGIKQLRDKGLIDARLFDWSQHLHAFRNLAAHPDDDAAAITRQDAEDLQTFVYAIIEYIYDLADRYDEFKERLAKREEAKKRRIARIKP